MTDKVEISENSLALLVSESERTLENLHHDGLPGDEYERISGAIEEAREAMN